MFIVQKLAEEWLGLHVCVKTPCRTAGCPAELLWPDMDGTHIRCVSAAPRQTEGCSSGGCNCSADGAGQLLEAVLVTLVMKLSGHFTARSTAGRGVGSIYSCGNAELGKRGKKVETLGIGHIMSILALCPCVPCVKRSWRASGTWEGSSCPTEGRTSGPGGKSEPLCPPWHCLQGKKC